MAPKVAAKLLSDLGYEIDPADPTQARKIEDAQPREDWSLEQLGIYASQGIRQFKAIYNEAQSLARKSTVELYRAGKAILIARKQLKHQRRFTQWLKEHKIPYANAYEAWRLAELAETEEEIKDLTPTQAKKKYGIYKPRRQSTHGAETEPTLVRDQPRICCEQPADIDDEPDDNLDDAEAPAEQEPDQEEPKDKPPSTLVRSLANIAQRLEDLACQEWFGEDPATLAAAIERLARATEHLASKLRAEQADDIEQYQPEGVAQ